MAEAEAEAEDAKEATKCAGWGSCQPNWIVYLGISGVRDYNSVIWQEIEMRQRFYGLYQILNQGRSIYCFFVKYDIILPLP